MKRNFYKGIINKLNNNEIFVFGSNPEGRHGKGAAKFAKDKFGAKQGQGHGLQGNSYGLVTKNLKNGYYDKVTNITYEKSGLKSVNTEQITENIKSLYKVARSHKDKLFYTAYSGNSKNLLNGYTSQEMANMFYSAKPIPMNIIFEYNFLNLVYKKNNN